jgi:3-deoxy-manno-octulosonate cytidylyltransferase (CMP-KDO synthetase)
MPPQSIPPCIGIIPARWASSRFPGKPLANILGKPMFLHVYERAQACPFLRDVVLATDDERILHAAKSLNVPVVMTRNDHVSGTDRIHEAACLLGVGEEEVVVNIQGDEPALDPEILTELLEPFEDQNVHIATPARQITPEEAARPDVVKVVVAENGNALYFSRAPIPFGGDPTLPEGQGFLGHIGLYAYRLPALRRFTELPPSPLEQREKLEQLRLLENGISIRVVRTSRRCHGVDRPEDIDSIIELVYNSK